MRRFFAFAIAASISMTSVPALAFKTETDASSFSSEQVVIKVDTENAVDGQLIMLEVLDKDKTFEMIDPSDPGTVMEAVIYIGQAETEQDGACEFRFDFPYEMGEYMYRAADEYGSIEENSFFYFTQDDIDETVESLNNAQENDFIELMKMEEVQKLLMLNTSDFDSIADKESVLRMMYSEHEMDGQRHTAEQFSDMFLRAIFLEKIYKAADTEEVQRLMDEYSDVLAVNELKMYDVFSNTLSSSLRNEVYKALAGTKFENISDFYSAMDLYTVTKTLAKVSNWKEASAILKGAEEALELGLDMNGYNSLNDPSAVDMIMIKASLTDWNSVTTAFNNAVSECKAKENQPSSGGSGSSGGGGGGTTTSSQQSSSLGPLSMFNSPTPLETIEPADGSGQEDKEFDDLDGMDWAKESILYLKDNGILDGRGDGKFCPEEYITREEFAKLLVSALDIFNEYAVCSFSDTDSEQWYYPYVASAYENGIVDGIDEDLFGIGLPITRQDAAVMSCRALEFIGVSLKETADAEAFGDEDEISDYAEEAIHDMSQTGIINGYTDGSFRPKEHITRAETACIIYRMLMSIEASYTIE